jgi:hypothetical protein
MDRVRIQVSQVPQNSRWKTPQKEISKSIKIEPSDRGKVRPVNVDISSGCDHQNTSADLSALVKFTLGLRNTQPMQKCRWVACGFRSAKSLKIHAGKLLKKKFQNQ